ncbi:molybdenum cofactor guanylyltransferase [Rheinheimera sp.]|uniref:molybdenum cofactor guanylyltransferase n=1 Tax=Rheinheimera sp. TaxID=1869214 RepID=UPI0040473BE6
MSSNKPFSALILAGGKSSRMGRDKALLQLNGQSLLAHMQQLAINSGAAEVLVSRNQPGFINDTEHQAGPLAGILAALAHCTTSQLLILPVDTPLLSAASLQQLLQANGDAAYFANSPLPCVLPLSPALSELISKQLHRGQRSVKALLSSLNAVALPAPAKELLNTNTPADWQQCLAVVNHGSLYAKA